MSPSVFVCRTPHSLGFMSQRVMVQFTSASLSTVTQKCSSSRTASCQRDGAEGQTLSLLSLEVGAELDLSVIFGSSTE